MHMTPYEIIITIAGLLAVFAPLALTISEVIRRTK